MTNEVSQNKEKEILWTLHGESKRLLDAAFRLVGNNDAEYNQKQMSVIQDVFNKLMYLKEQILKVFYGTGTTFLTPGLNSG